MFDDHCCDITGSGTYLAPNGPSRGLVLKLDFANHTVSQVAEYKISNLFHSEYMGNVEQLPDGDTFIGWGQVPYVTEFNKKGKPIFIGAYPSPDMAYRSYLQKWVGTPLYPPSAVATSSGNRTTVAVSWNGATQVTRWRVISATGQTLATASRSGFETKIPLSSGATSLSVQALGAGGRVLGTSKTIAVRS
jgi:hypothetical protein